jgi:hypothetical protein
MTVTAVTVTLDTDSRLVGNSHYHDISFSRFKYMNSVHTFYVSF